MVKPPPPPPPKTEECIFFQSVTNQYKESVSYTLATRSISAIPSPESKCRGTPQIQITVSVKKTGLNSKMIVILKQNIITQLFGHPMGGLKSGAYFWSGFKVFITLRQNSLNITQNKPICNFTTSVLIIFCKHCCRNTLYNRQFKDPGECNPALPAVIGGGSRHPSL